MAAGKAGGVALWRRDCFRWGRTGFSWFDDVADFVPASLSTPDLLHKRNSGDGTPVFT